MAARTITSIRDLSAAVRGRRRALHLSQADLAARADVSRDWIGSFEKGKPTVEIGHVLRVLDALGLALRIDAAARHDPEVDLDAVLDEYGLDEDGLDEHGMA